MIEIGLLGSLRVCRDGVDVTPSAPKLRQVLSLLLLNVNSLVSVDQLCDELWEDQPPLSALTTLQTYIYQLRRRLSLATGQEGTPFASCPPHGEPALLTRVGGYEMRLDGRQAVDAYGFEYLAEQGRVAHRSGASEEASGFFQEALSLWQGHALVDVAAGRRLAPWATQLEEKRISVMEQRFSIELELGHHEVVLEELHQAFGGHPTHEAFADLLMRALHACGRRPEALGVFRTLRTRLIDDLGLEPSAALQRRHQEVLADEPAEPRSLESSGITPRRAGVEPAQLPADVAEFVGRATELAQAEEYLGGDRRGGVGMRVVEVHGPPGVGKTAFAVRAAHRLRRQFPDGQLFIDLSEVDNGSAQLMDVLTASLASCGIRREKLPTSLEELSRLFRSWSADRRVLVVVDDVIAASQLRPLMPGGSGCAVIATNRYRAHGLSTGRKVTLSALSPAEARDLHGRVVGCANVDYGSDAVSELVRMTEGLPLAIRATAGWLAARPGWTVARLVGRLRIDARLLLELPAGSRSIVDTVTRSYRHLSPGQRHVLHQLVGDHRRHWSTDEVAELMPGGTGAAERLLEDLVDVHLVEEFLPPVLPGVVVDTGREPLFTVPGLTRQAIVLMRERAQPPPSGTGEGVRPRREPHSATSF
ncbi:BTAD domain-containing putative transcriptional regulator [Streptomyces kronopolitis]|uniref:AfsR/SARP family transcriptional regulator n=1 Tax=Streptomyces kronopolitis TaxID=1612435 RepID=UPI0034371972